MAMGKYQSYLGTPYSSLSKKRKEKKTILRESPKAPQVNISHILII